MKKNHPHTHQHPKTEREALKVRLRKIEGQLRAMEAMVDRDEDCSEILTQLISARKALKSFAEKLIESHMHHCIEDAQDSHGKENGKEKLRDLLKVLGRYVE